VTVELVDGEPNGLRTIPGGLLWSSLEIGGLIRHSFAAASLNKLHQVD
jgi:hypothetical protein